MTLLTDFKKLKDEGGLNAETASRLAFSAVDQLINQDRHDPPYSDDNNYVRDAVTLLCEITADKDPGLARIGITALFPTLIEKLNDSFDPALCSLYDQVFSQVIDFYRRVAGGEELDEGLRRFDLVDEADLLRRKSRVLKPRIPDPHSFGAVKKVLLLSRVTIGADVAVTSVIIAKLRKVLPAAEFVILGSHKLRDLFDGDPHLRIREITYERTGGVLARLKSWLDVVKAVADEQRGYQRDEFWLIDPDSRLTQLGLLPLLSDETNYFFFESRSYRRSDAGPLGALTSCWVDELFGTRGGALSYVSLPEAHRLFGEAIGQRLRGGRTSHLVTISLGVGGNEGKRISDSFEEELILRILQDSTIILDKGASREERQHINRIAAMVRAQGQIVIEADERNAAELLRQQTIGADVLTWEGGIGSFAALIAASDEYIGYDSAGQHIAVALGRPTLTIFVNSNSPTFAERWRPFGSGESRALIVDPARRADPQNVLSDALKLHGLLRSLAWLAYFIAFASSSLISNSAISLGTLVM